MAKTLTYEQPTDELIRVCLRLELLFSQLDEAHGQHTTFWQTRHVIEALLEILAVVDRADLKNRFTQTLSNYGVFFSSLDSNPHVNQSSLEALLFDIDQCIDGLHAEPSKIGQSLRERPFLNQIRQHASSSGGLIPFNTPAFHLWLHQSPTIRNQDCQRWVDSLALLRSTVTTILKITRSSKRTSKEVAKNGYFQVTFDPNHQAPLNLIQVIMDDSQTFYPRISVNKHRVSIYFYQLGPLDDRHEIHAEDHDIPFTLSCCLQQVSA